MEEEPPEESAEDALEDVRRMLRQEDWDDNAREPLYRRYVPQEPEEEEPFPEPEAEAPPAPKPRRRGGLVAVVVIETLILLAMIGWWFLWRK